MCLLFLGLFYFYCPTFLAEWFFPFLPNFLPIFCPSNLSVSFQVLALTQSFFHFLVPIELHCLPEVIWSDLIGANLIVAHLQPKLSNFSSSSTSGSSSTKPSKFLPDSSSSDLLWVHSNDCPSPNVGRVKMRKVKHCLSSQILDFDPEHSRWLCASEDLQNILMTMIDRLDQKGHFGYLNFWRRKTWQSVTPPHSSKVNILGALWIFFFSWYGPLCAFVPKGPCSVCGVKWSKWSMLKCKCSCKGS